MLDVSLDLELTRKLPVLDAEDAVVFYADPNRAYGLIRDGLVAVIFAGKHPRALRQVGTIRDLRKYRESRFKRGVGSSHRRETYENPAGCWTIDRIDPKLARYFGRARLK